MKNIKTKVHKTKKEISRLSSNLNSQKFCISLEKQNKFKSLWSCYANADTIHTILRTSKKNDELFSNEFLN